MHRPRPGSDGEVVKVKLHWVAYVVAAYLDYALYMLVRGVYETIQLHGVRSIETWTVFLCSLWIGAFAIPFSAFVLRCRVPLVIRPDGVERTTLRYGRVRFPWSDIVDIELRGHDEPRNISSSIVLIEVSEEWRRRVGRRRSWIARTLLPLPKHWATPTVATVRGRRLYELLRSRHPRYRTEPTDALAVATPWSTPLRRGPGP